MQYTETQLTKLIADVEKEFTAHLAKAEDTGVSLSKSEDGEEKPKEHEEKEHKEKPEHKPEEHSPEHKPEEDHSEDHAPEDQHEGATPEMQAKPDHDYDAEDLEHLHKMYMSMSEGERKVHHDAIMKCGDMAMMGKSEIEKENKLSPKPTVKGDNLDSDAQNGAIDGNAGPHNALGAKSLASDSNGAKINKSEYQRRNGGKVEGQAPGKTPGAKSPASKADGVQMEKSEQGTEAELLKSELDAIKAEKDVLQKNFDGVAAFLSKLLEKKTAPAAKAITSLDAITKSEGGQEEKTLTKSEIDSTLLRKSQDPSTSKADRDAINAYYLSGEGIKSISHLLK